jgi:hypothetical protein
MCTLSPDTMATRKADLLTRLVARATSIEPLGEGMRLSFAPSTKTVQTIVAAIDAERQCCRFLRFALNVEPDLGPIVLEVSGPAGTRRFLEGLGWSAETRRR